MPNQRLFSAAAYAAAWTILMLPAGCAPAESVDDPPDNDSSTIGSVQLDPAVEKASYQLALDHADVPTATVADADGLLTWRYSGQATFQRKRNGARASWVTEDDRYRDSTVAAMHQLVKIDALGRRWEVDALDVDALRNRLQRWYDDSPEYDARDAYRDPEVPFEDPSASVETYFWQPTSWTSLSCDGSVYHRWEEESRSSVTTWNNRRDTAILVTINNDPGFTTCTGVLLPNNIVLTAAHCVLDNGPINANDMRLYTRGNRLAVDAKQSKVDWFIYNNNYSGAGSANDWAMLKAKNPLWTSLSTMSTSQASDGVIEDLSIHNLGYPGHYPGSCSVNLVAASEWPDFSSMGLYHSTAPISGLLNNVIRTYHDSGPGHSGGPFYYCPALDDNECVGSETGFVVGLSTAWNPAVSRYVGPKMSAFRDLVCPHTNEC